MHRNQWTLRAIFVAASVIVAVPPYLRESSGIARADANVDAPTVTSLAPMRDGFKWGITHLDVITAFNKLLVQVARKRAESVTLVDLNKMLDPDGHYQSDVDGVTVRWSDGIHISKAGGEWLQPRILPLVDRLGLAARVSKGTVTAHP